MMDDVPKPITVWMVHLERGGDLREIKGTLRLDEAAIVFEDRDGATTRFPFEAVRKAKRTIGSPVMLVRWERDGTPRETAFYFIQPPPLPGHPVDPETETRAAVADLYRARRPAPASLFRGQSSKRRQRKQAMSYMTARAGTSREAIKIWVRAISERAQPGR